MIIEHMSQQDQTTPSPDVRAKVVYDHLKKTMSDLTNWDLICFCEEYIAAQSLTYEWLQPGAKEITRLVYTAHYMNGNNIETGLKR